MRILLLVNNLGIGGTERQTAELGRSLAEQGHQVCIGYFSNANNFEGLLNRAGVTFQQLTPRPDYCRPWTFAHAVEATEKLCKKFSPELIHSNLELADVVGQRVTLNRGLPHIISFRNAHWWQSRSIFSYWRIVYRKRWLRKGNPFFTAVSHEAAKQAAQALNIDLAEITVIPNGVRLERFRKANWFDPDYCPEIWKILCVGRLNWLKGQDLLIRAMTCTPLSKRTDVQLLLAGDGQMRHDLERLVQEFRIEDKVVFLGTRTDIPDLLSKADLYVQPSRSEGMPNTVIEALASGLPVIITDVPGMVEIVGRGKGVGEITAAENPQALAKTIAGYIENPTMCRSKAIIAKKYAQQFSIEFATGLVETIYSRALNA